MLLLFYQGSQIAAFSDVPILPIPGRRKRRERLPQETPVFIPLERQVRVAQAREVNAKGYLATLAVRTQLDTIAKATATRRANALAKQRAVVAELADTVEKLTAALAVEREETDLAFVFSILNEV